MKLTYSTKLIRKALISAGMAKKAKKQKKTEKKKGKKRG